MFTTVPPKQPALQPFVDSIYLIEGSGLKDLHYLAFPHTNTGLSFFRGASVSRGDHEVQIEDGAPDAYHIEVLGKYTRPVRVHYHGHFEEVSVIFKPMGINRFFRRDFATLAPAFSQAMVDPEWMKFSVELFAAKDRITCVEDFLLRQLRDNDELFKIASTLPMLSQTDAPPRLADIAAGVHMSTKTYQRHFHRHLSCTPSEYRRIARFRQVLSSRVDPADWQTLTSLSHEHQYADQSHFIREFHKLTGQKPGSFFRKARAVDGQRIIWEIL